MSLILFILSKKFDDSVTSAIFFLFKFVEGVSAAVTDASFSL